MYLKTGAFQWTKRATLEPEFGASGYGAGGLYLKTALRPVSSVISSRAEAPTPSACQRWEHELRRAGDTSSAITGLADLTEKTEGADVAKCARRPDPSE